MTSRSVLRRFAPSIMPVGAIKHRMAKYKFAGKKKKPTAAEANANWISCLILVGLILIAVAALFFFAIAGS